MAMTVRDVQDLIGKTGDWQTGGVTVEVRVVDVRSSWGRTDLQIEPVRGSGAVWVTFDRVKIG